MTSDGIPRMVDYAVKHDKSKILKDQRIWDVNGFSINLEYYDSWIVMKDENGNSMRITKKEPLKLILNLVGSFKTD